MTIKEVLPRIYETSSQRNNPDWDCEVNWNDCAYLEVFEDIISNELESTSRIGFEAFNNKALCIYKEILDAKQDLMNSKLINCDFVKFILCAEIAKYSNSKGTFTYTHDWIARSIYDYADVPQKIYPDINNLRSYLLSENRYLQNNILPVLANWTNQLFYYSWRFGGLKELCQLYLDHLWELVKEIIPIVQGTCYMYSNILTWSINNNYDKTENEIIQQFEILNDKIDVDEEVKKIIRMTMATQNSGKSKYKNHEWAKLVLNNHLNELRFHEEMQMIILSCKDYQDILDNESRLMDSIINYNNSIKNNHERRILLEYERTRIYNILIPLLYTLLTQGNYAYITNVLSTFFDIEDKNKNLNTVYVIPNFDKGVLYLSKKKYQINEYDVRKEYPELINNTNEFLGTSVVIRGNTSNIGKLPLCTGIPNPNISDIFEASLNSKYKTETIEVIEDVDSITMMPGLQHPIQNLILKNNGATRPINVSFQKPEDDREIKNAFIWSGGPWNSYIEKDSVTKHLSRNGVIVDTNTIGADKELFINSYTSNKYDLFWITTHGEYNHFSPHNSFIRLNDNENISLMELADLNLTINKRRLLIMNICDGATCASYDSIYRIGIGVSLTNKHQAVISHIWPISNVASLIFGSLFTMSISINRNYFDSYKWTIENMLKDKMDIISILEGYFEKNDENIQRIRNNSYDNKIVNWGCPVFYC